MGAVSTRRWVEGDKAWFAVSGVDADLVPSGEHSLMGYERVGGDGWRIGYPADTPELDRVWENFARYIELMLRQAAGFEPVPWREALRQLCRRTDGQSVWWWLTGSAALAVRGAPVEPGDIDVVCGVEDAAVLGELFADEMVEPVVRSPDEWISEVWGRAFCGARVEWIGGARFWVDEPEPSDFGPVAASRLETVAFEDWTIRVPPLDLQRAVSQRRGLLHRVAIIDSLPS